MQLRMTTKTLGARRLVPFLGLLFGGCFLLADSEPSPSELPLRTDQTQYIAQQARGGTRPTYGFDLIARYENRTGRTVFLARCYPDSPHPIYGVELVGQKDDWGAAYDRAWACVGHENPIAVAAGETRADTLHMTGPNAWPHGSGQHFGVLEGRFRLRYGAQSCRSEIGCELPDSLQRSNEFEVRLSQ